MNGTDVFFHDGVMFEVACETNGKCDVDQRSFKAYLARWMAASTKVAPFLFDQVMARLRPSAAAAALQCSGGNNGRTCGLKWTEGAVWDGLSGFGEQMSALEVIQSNLIKQARGPVTNATGGTSLGNPNAGANSGGSDDYDAGAAAAAAALAAVTIGDKVGAGFVTTALLVGMLTAQCWMIRGG